MANNQGMRAKVKITGVEKQGETHEKLTFNFPAKDGGYPADGSDEDQQFAKFSPQGALSITIANPALLGKFAVGDKFYLDFQPIAE